LDHRERQTSEDSNIQAFKLKLKVLSGRAMVLWGICPPDPAEMAEMLKLRHFKA